jgi:hypothetical protein
MTDADRDLLRHMIATLAYRAGKALRGAPDGFAAFRPDGAFNTPLAVLAHIADLIEWTHRWCDGDEDAYRITEPTSWDGEMARFFDALAALDTRVVSGPIAAPLERLFQAPIADAFTHVGQIALLRRLAGSPVLGEAYRHAPIEAGRVGPDQGPPGREFALDRGAIWRASRTR